MATVRVLDDFNRANGAAGSNWTAVTGATAPTIVSNVLKHAGASLGGVLYTGRTWGNDQSCEADCTAVNAVGASEAVSVQVRSDATTDNQYELTWGEGGGGDYSLRKWVSGTPTVLGTTTGVGFTGTRHLRIEAVGTSIKAFVNGVQLFSVTDASIVSGTPSIWITEQGCYVDNFEAFDFSSLTDNFNRANGGLGANWTTSPGLTAPTIAGNLVTGPTDNTVYGAYRSAGSFSDDQYAELYATLGGTNSECGPSVRQSAAANTSYFAVWSTATGGTYALVRVVAGTYTTLSSVTGVGTTGTRKLRIEARGSTLVMHVNDVAVLAANDATITTGRPAFYQFRDVGATTNIDNFDAGDLLVKRRNLVALDVNSIGGGGHGNQTAATTSLGTVTANAMLIVAQFGTMFQNVGNPTWAVPTKSAGTATIGTPVEIDNVFPINGNNFASTCLTVWQIPVLTGGTLTLQTDENLSGAGTSGSWGWGLIVDEIAGHDSGTPIVGAVARSWDSNTGGINQSAANSTLGATPTTDDLLYVFASFDMDAGVNSLAAGAGWAGVAEVTPDATVYTAGGAAINANTTSTTVVWPTQTSAGDAYSLAGIAFIVKAGGPSEDLTTVGTSSLVIAASGTVVKTELPSIGFRLTMAGDRVLTMAGDNVTLMGGSGALTPPQQRGTATQAGSWPIAASTGQATGDVGYLAIYVEDPTDDPDWALSGGDRIFHEQQGTSGVWLTVFAIDITGAPPANFTATTAATLTYWYAEYVSFYDTDRANEVIGASLNTNPAGVTGQVIPGITVVDDSSVVLNFATQRFGTVSPDGWPSLIVADIDIYAESFDAGPTGNIPATWTQGFQPLISVLVSVAPIGGASGEQYDVVGTESLALAASGGAVKHGATTGASQLVLAASGTVVKHAASTAATSLTLSASGVALEESATVGATAIALTASGTVVKHGAATAAVPIVLAASASASKVGAASASTSIALSASGTDVKAGDTTGSTSLDFSAAGTPTSKDVATVGATSLALAAAGVASIFENKSTTGATSLTLSAAAAVQRHSATTGATNVALAAAGAATGHRSTVGADSLTLSGAGTTANKDVSTVGATSITFASDGTVGATADGDTVGSTTISLSAAGSVVKHVAATAATAFALAAAGTDIKHGDATATSPLVLGSSGATAKSVLTVGATSLALTAAGAAIATNDGATTGVTAITFNTSGSVVKHAAPYGTAAIAFGSLGAAIKRGLATATAPITLTTVGTPFKTTGVIGDTTLTLTTDPLVVKVGATIASAALALAGAGSVAVGDGSYRPSSRRTLTVAEEHRVLRVHRDDRTLHIPADPSSSRTIHADRRYEWP